jgi:hypothetical protein
VASLACPARSGFEPDLDAMIPLERWTFDSLEAGA